MKRAAIFLLCALGCAPAQMWIPLNEPAARAPRAQETVVILEHEPTDRSFKVIGLIAPPEDEYESYAEMINAARKEAAKRGADAIFIASEKDKSGWSFSGGPFGAEGGATSTTAVRVKAIVWQ